MKGLLENLFTIMNTREYAIEKTGTTSTADLNYRLVVHKEEVGFIRQFASGIPSQGTLPSFVLQLSLSRLFFFLDREGEKKYTPVSYLPVITKNISFLIVKKIPVEQIIRLMKKEGGQFLLHASLVDVYNWQGKASLHSLNFRLSFQGKVANLQNAEVEGQIEKIWQALTSEFSVLRR